MRSSLEVGILVASFKKKEYWFWEQVSGWRQNDDFCGVWCLLVEISWISDSGLEGRKNNPVLRIKDDLNGLVLEQTGGPHKSCIYNI